MHSSLLESIIVTDFKATEAYLSLDLTKENYNIDKLLKVEKENYISQISHSNFITFEKRKLGCRCK
jgi:hypothetical protein